MAKLFFVLLLITLMLPINSMFVSGAIDLSIINLAREFVDDLDRLQQGELPDPSSYGLEVADLASTLFCGCKATDSCEGFLSYVCDDFFGTNVEINAPGLFWASNMLQNPELTFCQMGFQGYAANLGLSVDNSQRNATYQGKPNAYIEAARIFSNDEYKYYFSFNFFPTEEFSSNKVRFIVKQGSATINLDTTVFPEANQGFQHRYTYRTTELYNEACMKFSERPAGFSSDELCVRVVQI
jgi:hypothetical protein